MTYDTAHKIVGFLLSLAIIAWVLWGLVLFATVPELDNTTLHKTTDRLSLPCPQGGE